MQNPPPGRFRGPGFYVEESSRGTAACGDDMRSFGDAHNVFDILLCLTLFSFSRDAGTAHGVHRVADRVEEQADIPHQRGGPAARTFPERSCSTRRSAWATVIFAAIMFVSAKFRCSSSSKRSRARRAAPKVPLR